MKRKVFSLAFAGALAGALVVVSCSDEDELLAPLLTETIDLTAPVFGLGTNRDGTLVAAETLKGITEIRRVGVSLIAELPGVSAVAPIRRGDLFAVTGDDELTGPAPTNQKLFRITQGSVKEVANLLAFEQSVNPDQIWNSGPPDSNPFDVFLLSDGAALVADAGGNDALRVDAQGNVDWVAVLTPQLASTASYKTLIGCSRSAPPPTCAALPDSMPAQPVPTTAVVGPDGAYYVGELTGFPGTPGISRVWRVAPGSLHVVCPSASCTKVLGGFTSIMHMRFGGDGLLYIVEFDVAGWIAVETRANGGPLKPVQGGRVQACNVNTGSCTVRASAALVAHRHHSGSRAHALDRGE